MFKFQIFVLLSFFPFMISVPTKSIEQLDTNSFVVHQVFSAVAPDIYARLDSLEPNALTDTTPTIVFAMEKRLDRSRARHINDLWVDKKTHLEKVNSIQIIDSLCANHNHKCRNGSFWDTEYVIKFNVHVGDEKDLQSNNRMITCSATIYKRSNDPIAYALVSFKLMNNQKEFKS